MEHCQWAWHWNARECPCREAEAVMVAVIKRKISVILADDHPVVRDGLAAMVNQQADMEVVAEASDGDEAIVLYEQHRPDVMVLDLRMPKRDGVAVLQRVLEINPKACILIMTTYDGDEDIFQCLSQGAKGYLLKDAPRQEILSAIRAVSEDRPYTSSTVAAKALQRMAKPSLTQRELDVLQLVAEGRSNKDIAPRRWPSPISAASSTCNSEPPAARNERTAPAPSMLPCSPGHEAGQAFVAG